MKALIIVDVQEDFLPPNGSLAVNNGREVIPVINKMSKEGNFDLIITTQVDTKVRVTLFTRQDWHPKQHISFAKTHNRDPFTSIQIGEQEQMLWPVHCVQNTPGAELAPELDLSKVKHRVKKGTLLNKDAYSGFQNTDEKSLAKILRDAEIEQVYVVGVATDYCVRATAIDANKEGFETFIVKEGVRAVYPDKQDDVFRELSASGISIISV